MFREAAFEELEFVMNSEMKLNSTREALDIMYQPRDSLYGDGVDDDNFFLYLEDKSMSFCSIQSTSYSNSNINVNNNNDNINCQNYNNNYYEAIDNINSINNNYHNDCNINYSSPENKSHSNNQSKNNGMNKNDGYNETKYKNDKNNNEKTDLFGVKKTIKNDEIFDFSKATHNPNILSVSVTTSLNIQGINQIAKFDEKKRDDDKSKGKDKDLINYDTALGSSTHVHPLAYICV